MTRLEELAATAPPPPLPPPNADSSRTTTEGPATASGPLETGWSSASSTTPRLSLRRCPQPAGAAAMWSLWGMGIIIFETLSATGR